MKNKLLKSFVILALLISLVTTLVACDNNDKGNEGGNANNGGNDTTQDAGTLTELNPDYLPLDNAIDKAQKDEAKKLYNELKSKFGVINTESNKFVTSSGKMEVTAPKNAKNPFFEFDAEHKVYVDFSIESYIDTNLTAGKNKTQTFVSLNASGKKTGATDSLVIYTLFDAQAQSVKVYALKGTDETKLNIKTSDVATIGNSLNAIGKPNLPSSLGGILAQIDEGLAGMDLSSIIGAESLTQLYTQQLEPLINRMLFNKTASGFDSIVKKDATTGEYNLVLTSNQINTVMGEFFDRGSKIANDSSYYPTIDYRTASGTAGTNTADTHNNNSDEFFKNFSGVIDKINAIIKDSDKKLKNNINDWKTGFGFSNDAFTLQAKMAPTANGFENGLVELNIKEGATVKVPFKNFSLGTLPQDVLVKMYDLNVIVEDMTSFKAVKPSDDAKTKLDAITKPATNLINVNNEMLKFVGVKADNSKIEATLKVNSLDINPFELLNIDAHNGDAKNIEIVKKAINNIDIEIIDNTKTLFSIKWNVDKLDIVTSSGAKTFTAQQIVNTILNSKTLITSKVNGKDIMGLISGIDLGSFKNVTSTLPSYDKLTKIFTYNSGFDTAILNLFKTSYNDLLGQNLDIMLEIFGKDNGVVKVEISKPIL